MEVERVKVAGTDSNNSLLKLSWKELPAIFSLISFNLNRQILWEVAYMDTPSLIYL